MRILKYFLKIIVLTFIISVILLLIPRFLSVVQPKKPPVGYHFELPTYVAIWTGLEKLIDKEPDIPAEIEEIKNIEYKNINGKSLQIDFYRLRNLDVKAPLIVFIHGGGWKGGKRSDYLTYLVPFAQKGYITATVSYRLVKDGKYPACVEDISDAFQWFYNNGDNFGYDADRIGVVGGSAGAHLAMLAAYGWENSNYLTDSADIASEKHRIKALVEIYGPTDLTTEYARNHELVTNFLGAKYKEKPELYFEASPVHYLDKNDPPTLILHGTSDSLVPVSQADLLQSKLDSLGVPCKVFKLPLWPHTMDLAQRVNDFCRLNMNSFFDQYLK